jgi:hypothetical protein
MCIASSNKKMLPKWDSIYAFLRTSPALLTHDLNYIQLLNYGHEINITLTIQDLHNKQSVQ